MNLEEFERKKYPFKVSKVNLILAIIVGLLRGVISILFINDFTSLNIGYAIGIMFGSIIGALLISTLIAMLFWFIFGRKKDGGSITFIIVITLLFFGGILDFFRYLSLFV